MPQHISEGSTITIELEDGEPSAHRRADSTVFCEEENNKNYAHADVEDNNSNNPAVSSAPLLLYLHKHDPVDESFAFLTTYWFGGQSVRQLRSELATVVGLDRDQLVVIKYLPYNGKWRLLEDEPEETPASTSTSTSTTQKEEESRVEDEAQLAAPASSNLRRRDNVDALPSQTRTSRGGIWGKPIYLKDGGWDLPAFRTLTSHSQLVDFFGPIDVVVLQETNGGTDVHLWAFLSSYGPKEGGRRKKSRWEKRSKKRDLQDQDQPRRQKRDPERGIRIDVEEF